MCVQMMGGNDTKNVAFCFVSMKMRPAGQFVLCAFGMNGTATALPNNNNNNVTCYNVTGCCSFGQLKVFTSPSMILEQLFDAIRHMSASALARA
jgi:hypothetical protein